MSSEPRGPIDKQYTAKLRVTGTVTSSSSNIQLNMSTDPSGCTDWTHFASLFDCYRVDRIAMEFVPTETYDGALVYAPLVVFYDPDNAAFPSTVTNYDTAYQYEGAKICQTTKHWSCEVRPDQPTSVGAIAGSYHILAGGWMDIATPVGTSSLNAYGTGFTSAHAYGMYVLTYYVTFKVRR